MAIALAEDLISVRTLWSEALNKTREVLDAPQGATRGNVINLHLLSHKPLLTIGTLVFPLLALIGAIVGSASPLQGSLSRHPEAELRPQSRPDSGPILTFCPCLAIPCPLGTGLSFLLYQNHPLLRVLLFSVSSDCLGGVRKALCFLRLLSSLSA